MVIEGRGEDSRDDEGRYTGHVYRVIEGEVFSLLVPLSQIVAIQRRQGEHVASRHHDSQEAEA